MEDLLNSPWTVNIVGGIISTVVGGIIVAVITGARGAGGYHPTGLDHWMRMFLRLVVYGIGMVLVTAVVTLFYNTIAETRTLGPYAGILAIGLWLFGAVFLFGQLFLGWRSRGG